MRKIPIGVVNMIMFAVVVLATLVLRGPIGIGTLLAVALQGPIMQLVFHITHFEPRDVEQESLIETFRKLFPVRVPDPAARGGRPPAIPDKSTKIRVSPTDTRIFYLAEAEKSHRVRGSKAAKKIQSVFRGESVFLRAQRTKMRGSEGNLTKRVVLFAN